MSERLGRGFCLKNSSRLVRVWGVKTARFFRFRLVTIVSELDVVVLECAHKGLSASTSHFSKTCLMAAAFVGLSCICSKRLMVL